MTEQERQRTIDFILRSQADAVIRQERWEERMEERVGRWEERFERDMEKLRAEVREFAKAAHETLKATEKLARENREHERRIRKLEKSEKRTTRRFEGMRDILQILQRLEAHSAKRLDQLEKR